MRIDLSPAQCALRERFADLFDEDLTQAVRRMSGDTSDDESKELREVVWRALVDLGASRLLLPSRHGGEELGQQGAVMLVELLGAALYQGPLLDTMTASELLLAAGVGPGKLVEQIAEGASVALAPRQSGQDSPASPGPLTLSGDSVTGQRRFVAAAAEADFLCPVGSSPDGTICAVLAREHPGVSLRRQHDVGRGQLYQVSLDRVPAVLVQDGGSSFAAGWPRLLAHARLRQAAYLVGLSQAALDLAVQRARERKQFGQPIGRFQALAFGLASNATRLEAARWLVRATAWEADNGEDVRLHAAQALALTAELSRQVVSASMQVHGAYGTTEVADIQLFYRQGAVERVRLGAPQQLRAEVLPLLLAEHRQAARLTG
jgi:butyryl-CoA dehydrogenase